MGCDIHMYVEKLNPETKEWEFVDPPRVQMYFYPETMKEPVYGEYWYWDRNYSLFAMLADVRNGSGFAGVDIGRPVTPISQPRGIPEDASERYARIAGPYSPCGEPCEGADLDPEYGDCTAEHGWGEDGHSHSWFTARELHQVPWNDNLTTHHGVVNPANFLHWKEHGRPLTWSGGVFGPDIKHVTNEEMQALIDTKAVEVGPPLWWGGKDSYYTQVAWSETWAQATGKEWQGFLDRLNALSIDDGSDVRAVFFFDN